MQASIELLGKFIKGKSTLTGSVASGKVIACYVHTDGTFIIFAGKRETRVRFVIRDNYGCVDEIQLDERLELRDSAFKS